MNWLQEVRVGKGLTKEEVAIQSNITTQHYNYIEKRERKPSAEVAIRIARTLEFDWKIFYET